MRYGACHKRNSARRVVGARPANRYLTIGASLGLPPLETDALIRKVQTGLHYRALGTLSSESGISISEIGATMQVAELTLARRRATRRPWSREAAKLLRLPHLIHQTGRVLHGGA